MLGFAFTSFVCAYVCVHVCVCFFSEGEGNVFCRNVHSTLFDKVRGKICITTHDSHLHSIKLTALSFHMMCGGWSVLQSYSPFICVFDVAFILSRSNFFSDFFFLCHQCTYSILPSLCSCEHFLLCQVCRGPDHLCQ